jgi:hypothetical protein
MADILLFPLKAFLIGLDLAVSIDFDSYSIYNVACSFTTRYRVQYSTKGANCESG